MAIFLGTKEAMDAWMAMPDQKEKGREGMMAWSKWAEDHKDAVVSGAPLGKTKRVDKNGVSDTRNELGAYTIVKAESADEAAKMFLNHPHFMIFPGDHVEVMECLAIPTM